MYRIKIDYQTGNSFGSYNEVGYLDLTWKNLEVAKENLQRIKEHYEFYQSRQRYSKVPIEFPINKPWFVKKEVLYVKKSNSSISESQIKRFKPEELEYRIDDYHAEHCIKLVTDEGKDMQMFCFWTGYFESLNFIEIVAEELDLKIEF